MERLNVLFSSLLYFVLSTDNKFAVECIQNGKKETKNIEGKHLSEYLDVFLSSFEASPYSFSIKKEVNTAILELNSFDFYKEEEKNEYWNFLGSVFREIKESRIENLVIDIR